MEKRSCSGPSLGIPGELPLAVRHRERQVGVSVDSYW